MMPNGKDVILEVFGPGDPLGAVATSSAARSQPARRLSKTRPAWSFPRRISSDCSNSTRRWSEDCFLGFTIRIVELINRFAEMTGGRIEARFARLFLKLADGDRAARNAAARSSRCRFRGKSSRT